MSCARLLLMASVFSAALAVAATFGTVVPIGGHASDIALDEKRGVLYIANFTANQIDVMSLRTNTIQRSINVARQPSAIALSRDGRWLVITHYGKGTPRHNAVTVLDLDENSRREFALAAAPLGVAFGFDDRAFIVTAADFMRMDPVTGHVQRTASVLDVVGKVLPVEMNTFPPQIIEAAVTPSADGRYIFGMAQTGEGSSTGILFRYDVLQGMFGIISASASPALGPLSVSVSDDGAYFTAGWWLVGSDGHLRGDPRSVHIKGEFPNAPEADDITRRTNSTATTMDLDVPAGLFQVGSHAIDAGAGVIYAQVPSGKEEECVMPSDRKSDGTLCGADAASLQPGWVPGQERSGIPWTEPRVLQILAADNLQVLERIRIPENLMGRSVLNSARDVMYSGSDSGVLVLPVGWLNAHKRVRAEQEMLVFRNNGCTRQLQTQDLVITDPGGNGTRFQLVSASDGVRISSAAGITPAVVQVTVDPGKFTSRGTDVAWIQIISDEAVNLPYAVPVHVNNREPDQRGTMISVAGRLVDLLPDPVRDRTYIIRQDTNEILVFDNRTNRQTATLRTGTRPMHMATTLDGRYLLIANDRSQLATVFNLDTMQAERPVIFPFNHFPRSIAVSGNAILAISRRTDEPEKAMIDKIDMHLRIATTLPTLGIYKNELPADSVLAATPNGASVMVAVPDGNVMIYDANKDTFTASRKMPGELSGAYAASNYNRFAVGTYLLNESLVPVGAAAGDGSSSGMFFVDQTGFYTTNSADSVPGTIYRLDMARGRGMLPTSMTEAPPVNGKKFIRSLAALPNRAAIISLSRTGFTVLPWNYDAAFAPPRIEGVVSAADRSDSIAPGGLVSILGRDLSPFNVSTEDPTVADALPEACLTVNGTTAPIIFASPERINAQLPFNAGGTTTLILRTPGGASDSFRLRVAPSAPTVFRSGTAGPETGLPAVIRAVNNDLVTLSNPIHPGDEIVIYATGLGRTNPEVPAGTPAPYEPLARAVETPQVQLGGVDLNVFYSGLTPGLVGVYQINALVPLNVPTGFDIPLSVGRDEHITTLNVRVVR